MRVDDQEDPVPRRHSNSADVMPPALNRQGLTLLVGARYARIAGPESACDNHCVGASSVSGFHTEPDARSFCHFIEHFPYAARELIEGEGLLKQPHSRIKATVVDDSVA